MGLDNKLFESHLFRLYANCTIENFHKPSIHLRNCRSANMGDRAFLNRIFLTAGEAVTGPLDVNTSMARMLPFKQVTFLSPLVLVVKFLFLVLHRGG